MTGPRQVLDQLDVLHAETTVPQDPDARRVLDSAPALTAALRAVLDLHVPDENTEACEACWVGLDQNSACPTVRAVTAALGVPDTGGAER